MFKKISAWLTHKPYTKSAYVTAIGTVILVITTIGFTWSANSRTAKEFKLKMRPYLVIDEVVPTHIDEAIGETTYQIFIKNIGILPAKIKKMYVYIENQPHMNEYEFNKSDIISNNRRIFHEYKITLDDKKQSVNVVIKLIYNNALTNRNQSDYSTEFIFRHRLNKRPAIMGGFMR